MQFDKPAQVVWETNFTGTGQVDKTLIKVFDSNIAPVNIVNTYTDEGVYGYITPNYDSLQVVSYSIIDNNFNSNLRTFNFSFSAYNGPIFSDTMMIAVNYLSNNTSNEMVLELNYNNDIISPPFYFDPFTTSTPAPTKNYTIPAGAQNFPIPMWVNPNETNSSVTFSFRLSMGAPTITVNNNRAIFNSSV
jgi:hypothetical protein